MFTGIVEEVGEIVDVRRGSVSSSFVIRGAKVLEDTIEGDSICTEGVCLTVTNIESDLFHVDVMAETLRMSNLGQLKKGSKVNLERALTLGARLGGHLVSGHIDGVGVIKSTRVEGNATWVRVGVSTEILKYMIHKGSVTIDGISLTIARLDNQEFEVSLIPHTSNETTLLDKKSGDIVNIECDLISKYVERLMGFKKNDITLDLLKENGFM